MAKACVVRQTHTSQKAIIPTTDVADILALQTVCDTLNQMARASSRPDIRFLVIVEQDE